MHVVELVVGIVVFAGGQSLFATFAGANPDITPPTAPTNLAMTGRSATSIDLTWTAATDDVGVAGYNIYRGGTKVSSSATTDYTDSSLTPNTSYTYTVTATDAATNESPPSSGATISTLADTSAPNVPGNLHQTGQTTSTTSIAWDASTDNVGVAGYDVYRNGLLVRSQAGTSYTDTGLNVNTVYAYNISARDASNNSSNLSSTLYGVTSPDTTPPSVPDNLHETTSSVSSVTFAWTAATDDVGVAGYHVYRDGNLVGSPGGTSYTDTGLNVNSNYTYTVKAYDAAGNNSAVSTPLAGQSSSDTTAPTTPANLQTTDVKDTSISFSWDASTDDVGVTGYKIYRNNSFIGTVTATNYSDTSLTPVTHYDYKVEAYDAASNNSPDSAVLSTTTAFDTTAPSVPTNLQATTRTDSTIALTWDAATDNVAVSGYDVYRGGTLITTTVGTNFTDSGLSVNANYTYRVRAHDASSNNSAQSSALNTSTIADLIAPSIPTNLQSPAQTTGSVDLSWNAATDDVAVSGYKLYRGGVQVATVTGLSYTETGLHYNTSYSYTVTALDAAGNESPLSTALMISTLPDTQAPTVAITAPAAGATQLTFQITATANDDLDLSRVEFYADSTLIASISSPPFAFNWDSYAVHNGSHIITAKAIDATGNFSTQSVTINVTNPPPALVGDLNGDHKVNVFDLSIFLSHFNKAGSGDFNNNGKVDIFDLSVLLSHYGQDNSGYQ